MTTMATTRPMASKGRTIIALLLSAWDADVCPSVPCPRKNAAGMASPPTCVLFLRARHATGPP